MARNRTLEEIINMSVESEFYSKERKEEVIELIMKNNLKEALNKSEESKVLKFFQFMNIAPSNEQIVSYLEKNYPCLIKIESVDVFIAKEMLKEDITTFKDAINFKSDVNYNIDNSFFLEFNDIIYSIKKYAMRRLKSGMLKYSTAKEDSLFRHVDEYKEKLVDEINFVKLSRFKYFIHKLKKKFGFNN